MGFHAASDLQTGTVFSFTEGFRTVPARLQIHAAHVQRMYYVVFGLLAFTVAVVYPRHNWDTIAYAAATTRFESADARFAHSTAYREAQEYLPEVVYGFLTDETPTDYRAQVHADPQVFASQLAFYTGRPAYIGAAWLLRRTGLNTLFALHVLSGLSALGGVLCLFSIARSHLPAAGRIALPLAAALFGLFRVAQLGTPDSMAFAGVIASVWLLLRRQRALLLLLPVLLAVRTDLILWTLPLYVALFVTRSFAPRAIGASLVMSSLLFAVLQAQHPGLPALLSVTLLDNVPLDPAQAPHLTVAEYVGLLQRGLLDMRSDAACGLFLLVLATAAGVTLERRHSAPDERMLILLLAATLAYFVAHFLLFPACWERFFVGPYTIAAFSVMALLQRPATALRLAA